MITYSMFTAVGGRELNEDAAGAAADRHGGCFVLCDGLGGHGMGDAASQLVKDSMLSLYDKDTAPEKMLADMFELSQQRLTDEQTNKNVANKMKTTASVLILSDKKAAVGHIGDSRLYAFSDGKIVFRTKDHSVTQMLALSGEISEKDIRNHPDRNILLRSMGTPWERPMYEITDISSLDADAFLLCSDGVWELLDDDGMCALLTRAKTVSEWSDMIKNAVEINGKGRNMDNYTAVTVWNR